MLYPLSYEGARTQATCLRACASTREHVAPGRHLAAQTEPGLGQDRSPIPKRRAIIGSRRG
jgi:hypothetical protein